MELNIIKQIKELRNILRRKPTLVVGKPKREKKVKAKPIAKKRTTVIIEGRELSLSQVAVRYDLEIATVRARYRVGNRGKLLIRPSHRQHKPT